MMRVERLAHENAPSAIEYLSRSPYEHVFLSYLALEGPAAMRRDLYVALDEIGDVGGVGFFGRQVALASELLALPALAALGRNRGERAITGPRETVRAYWHLVRKHHVPARLVRERQPVMAIDLARLRLHDGPVAVRRARDDEWTEVARNSAAMIAGELQTDPRREEPEFASGIRRMIRLGLWWVAQNADGLCFFCNVGPWSPQTAQLQGIWTPPELRGRGLATAALSAICRELLLDVPTLCLYVNDFNAPAIELYTRLGFYRVGEFQTIFF